MKYIVLAPPYRDKSYGNRVTYQLAELLLKNGENVCIKGINGHTYYSDRMKELNLSFLEGEPDTEDIVIYPDVVTQNISTNHQRAVRYLLHRPMHHNGGALPYGPHDLLITFSKAIDPDLLEVPILLDERHLFSPLTSSTKKNQAALYLGKGSETLDKPECKKFLEQFDEVVEITRDFPEDRTELAKLLKESKALITLDCLTGMILETLLCGTPVYLANDYFNIAKVGFAGLPCSGVFSKPEDFPSACEKVHHFSQEFESGLKQNKKRVSKFISFSKTYFQHIEDAERNDSPLPKYLATLNVSRTELDQFRWQDFQQSFLDEKHQEFHKKRQIEKELLYENSYQDLIHKVKSLKTQIQVLSDKNNALERAESKLKNRCSDQKNKINSLKKLTKSLEQFKSRALTSWRIDDAPTILKWALKMARLMRKVVPTSKYQRKT